MPVRPELRHDGYRVHIAYSDPAPKAAIADSWQRVSEGSDADWRLDGVLFRAQGQGKDLVEWTQPCFKNAILDNHTAVGEGPTRREFGFTHAAMRIHMRESVRSSGLAIWAFRPSFEESGNEFDELDGPGVEISEIQVLEINDITGAVMRAWQIDNPTMGEIHDVPRSTNPGRQWLQSVSVFTFSASDLSEITDESTRKAKRRPYPETA